MPLTDFQQYGIALDYLERQLPALFENSHTTPYMDTVTAINCVNDLIDRGANYSITHRDSLRQEIKDVVTDHHSSDLGNGGRLEFINDWNVRQPI